MKHGRQDYNRIQDPENKIGKDEPVFLLRAQDKFAPMVVNLWCALVASAGKNPTLAEHVAKTVIHPMKEWQKENKSKTPDMTTCGDEVKPDCGNCRLMDYCGDSRCFDFQKEKYEQKKQYEPTTYKRYEIVSAFRILEVHRRVDRHGILYVALDTDHNNNKEVVVSSEFMDEYQPRTGGYYVVSETEGKSCLSAEEFKAKHTKA